MYIERYQNGEYVRVWQELRALGTRVRQPEYVEDAMDVARETMKRVRRNIEILIPRLLQIGYTFGYDRRLAFPLQALEHVESRDQYIQMKVWTDAQPPVFLASKHQEERDAEAEKYKHDHPFGVITTQPSGERSPLERTIEAIEQRYGVFPLSIRAWYEEVGAVNFYGYHEQWVQVKRRFVSSHKHFSSDLFAPDGLMEACDPLQVCALTEQTVTDIAERARWYAEDVRLEFAPDRHGKDYLSGSTSAYTILLADEQTDAMMGVPYPPPKGSLWFVDYLRVSLLQWGGFPGMSEWPMTPREDIAFLTRDLVPF